MVSLHVIVTRNCWENELKRSEWGTLSEQ